MKKKYLYRWEQITPSFLGNDFTNFSDSIKISGQSYNDFIAAPPVQADTRPEIPLVDDTEFFKKYESTAAVVVPKAPVAEPVSRPAAEEKSVSQKSEELHNFYDSLMKRQSA
jgi:hypothetical protein